MKAKICHCRQCRAVRQRTRKSSRIQTYQVRATKSRVRRMLKHYEFDNLPQFVKVDYYG